MECIRLAASFRDVFDPLARLPCQFNPAATWRSGFAPLRGPTPSYGNPSMLRSRIALRFSEPARLQVPSISRCFTEPAHCAPIVIFGTKCLRNERTSGGFIISAFRFDRVSSFTNPSITSTTDTQYAHLHRRKVRLTHM